MSVAWAKDARVDYLSKQLAEAGDFRLRMQLVVALGAIPKEAAIAPLCGALQDKEPLVRQAAVKSLARTHYFSRLPCLESALTDADAAVRQEAARALRQAARCLKGYGFVLAAAPPAASKSSSNHISAVMRILHSKLSGMGARIAQEKSAGLKQVSMDKRYKLQVKALQKGEALKLEMLLMTFPSQSLKASFSVQARGKSAAVSKALEKMVQKLLEEAADEMKWFASAEGGHND